MNHDSLRIAVDVLRLRSFSVAAEKHGVTQSAVSQSVRQLERELGVTLVDRSRRPLVATEAGRILLDGCEPLLERFDRMLERIKTGTRELRGRVRLVSVDPAGLHWLPTVLAAFRARHPRVRIEQALGDENQVVEAVLGGRADLGVATAPREGRELAAHPLGRLGLALGVPRNHPLAADPENPLDPEALQGVPFVAYPPGRALRRLVDRCLKENGVRVRVVMEVEGTELARQAAAVLGAAAFLPRVALGRGEVVARDVSFSLPSRSLGVVHRRRVELSRAGAALLETLRSAPSPWTAEGEASWNAS